MFSLLIDAVILLLNLLYPELCTDTVFLYLMVLKIFPRLWGTGISDAIFLSFFFFLWHLFLVLSLNNSTP